MATSLVARHLPFRALCQYNTTPLIRNNAWKSGINVNLGAVIQGLQRCSFSTKLETKTEPSDSDNVIPLPPNLKIDPRSTCSPYYRLKKASKPAQATIEASETNEASTEATIDDTSPKQDIPDRSQYFDLTTRPNTVFHAIPLPTRLHVPVLHLPTAEKIGTIHLSDEIFGCDPIRVDILHRVVVYQRNKKRGKRKAKTKTVSEVRGSGRKVRPQKGQGRARAGHGRPAHWRGGAKAHGPKGSIQDYTTKLNKKVRAMGLRMALSQKLKEGNLIILGEMGLPSLRTKDAAKVLEHFDVAGRFGTTAYMIDDAIGPDSASADEDGEEEDDTPLSVNGVNANLKLATRNLHKVKLHNELGANVYDILKHEKLIMSLSAIQALEERLMPK